MADRADQASQISVVVPTRNRPHVLSRLVRSLASEENVTLELILVDDASDCRLDLETLRSEGESLPLFPIQIVRLDRPAGACRARNLGILEANAKYILFLDDDVELDGPRLLEELLKYAEARPEIGVLALAELAPDGRWGFNLAPDGPPMEVARFHGCGALFRRTCLETTGGFLEPLGYYYEEFEISMRVIAGGWRIVFHPAFRIIHHRDTVGRDTRRIARLISRNALLTAVARFPWWLMVIALPAQVARFTASSLKPGNVDLAGPFVVMWSFATALPKVYQYRNPLGWNSLRRYKQLARRPERFN